MESRLNCLLGGNGALLAVRRSLFRTTKQSIVEDFQITLEIRSKGYRVAYDPEAIAIEDFAPTFSAEFARRVRIGTGNYQTLVNNLAFLNPLNGLPAFAFFSHKVLRWLAPIFLLVAFVCSILMVRRPIFAALLVAQSLLYLAASLGYCLRSPARLFSVPLHFCSMNLALLLGLLRYLRGRQTLTWNPTPRRTPAEVVLNKTPGGPRNRQAVA
jgi:cellulose synthase/poly-beta-1,6-N-acetylglucosamine synthase-like glycosyltransferase